MSAFFSGTDNNDDRNSIGFSGVFGHLDKPEASSVWRFNYRDKKYETKLSDIFEAPAVEQVDIPDKWISQVKTVAHTPYQRPGGPGVPQMGAGYLSQYLGYATRGRQSAGPVGDDEAIEGYTFGGVSVPKHGGNNSSKKAHAPEAKQSQGSLVDQSGKPFGLQQPQFQKELEEQQAQHNLEFMSDFWGMNPGSSNDDELSLTDLILARSEQRMAAESLLGDDGDPVGGVESVIDSDRFNELMCNHGPRIAMSFCEIGERMVDLEGEDELLKEVVGDIIGLMDGENRAKLMRTIYETLPAKERDRIAQNGL